MSWFLGFAGFAVLIILHELGHFAAAKAVGMRVERFALFFPPLLFKVQRGETEYAIGAIPLGGYVKITGMNPEEEMSPEIAERAYYRQPPWKRIVVIAAGPLMNVLVAFLILWAVFLVNGKVGDSVSADRIEPGKPAAGVLRSGDVLVSVDGVRGGPKELSQQIGAHKCAGKPTAGCTATTPARVVVERDGHLRTFTVAPEYDPKNKRTRLGFGFAPVFVDVGPFDAASESVAGMWRVSKATISALARIFDAEQRKQISGVVGSYETARQSFEFDTEQAFMVLAIISLSLAIVNLFPFLPLDGGHIFWAVAEKLRGRAIPFSVMERAGVVGFLLVIMLFAIGLSNDIGRLRGEGFGVR